MDATTTIGAEVAVAGEEDPRKRLERLFDRQHLRLYRFALRMTRGAEEALDVVQEAFVRAASDAARLPADDELAGAWLVRVVVNLLHDAHRREAVRRAFRESPPARAPQRDFAEAIVARDAVRSAIALLPPRQRAIIVLHELEERSVAEIAADLRITRVTVRWHLAAARKRMAAFLEGAPS